MKYDMLSQKTVERVWKVFTGHNECINTKYKKFALHGEYDLSDRDRFVDRFFEKYSNRYIAFIDRQVRGVKYGNYIYLQKPESVYAPRYGKKSYTNQGEPYYRTQKLYLRVDGFHAVNEMYGLGYIEMSCTDVFGNKFSVQMDYNNMRHIQFKEITKKKFDSVAKMFQDDRSEIPFMVTRYLTWKEMQDRKIKGSDPVKEEVKVMARDMQEASKKLENIIGVRKE